MNSTPTSCHAPARTTLFAWAVVTGLLLANRTEGADVFWTNTAGGNWNVAANWSPNQVPGLNDTAFINNSTVTVSDNQSVAGLTLNAGILTVLNQGTFLLGSGSLISTSGTVTNQGALIFSSDSWLVPGGLTLIQDGVLKGANRGSNYLGSLTVASNAVVTHTRGNTNGVQLRVVGTLTVQAGGKIDVSSKGYRGGFRDGNNTGTGETRGPGGIGTTVGGATGGSGGSYGSLGASTFGGAANALYGSETTPEDLGSGGASQGAPDPGGNGGGRIEVEAGNIEVSGQILADGGDGFQNGGAGASGGSIYLRVVGGNFSGNGVVRASGGVPRGGPPGRFGPGGGGRIAIVGHINDTFAGTLGRAGTIFAQAASTDGSLSLDGGTLVIGAGQTRRFDLLTGTIFDPLTVTNQGTLIVGAGSLLTGGGLVHNEGAMSFGADAWTIPGGLTVIQDGVLKGANRGSNYLGSLTVASNAVVTHTRGNTNGVHLRVVGTLTVQAGGKIDVSSKGYRGGFRDGNDSGAGETRGPGGTGTTVGGATGGSGGSYGGLGASTFGGAANAVYGSETAPEDLGSGGASQGSPDPGGNGGGRIDIEAGNVDVGGQMLADGGDGFQNGGAGGSGGSIYLRIAGGSFSGNGVVRASGGVPRGGPPGRFGPGGGGRIAIVGHINNTFAGTLGRAGTIFVQAANTDGSLSLDGGTLVIGADQTRRFDLLTGTIFDPLTVTNQGTLVVGAGSLLIGGGLVHNEGAVSFGADAWTIPGGLTVIQDGVLKGANRGSNYLGSLTVASNAVVTHTRGNTNGVQLRVVSTLTVQAGGKIDVSSKGYRGGFRDGNDSGTGETRGPGGIGTTVGGATGGSGGSYGSLGASTFGGAANAVYGSETAPEDLGSGGASQGAPDPGGNGGGRIDVEAGATEVSGQMLADGGDGFQNGGAGGSGGSIYLRIAGGSFSGEGVVRANGGVPRGGPPGRFGSGGGGRIAIYYTINAFTGTLGGQGTLHLQQTETSPIIRVQPQSQIVALGGTAQLSVTAMGALPLAYQWRHNGANIPGGTNATYTIAAFDLSDAGNYNVAIANRFGVAVSQTIRLFPSLAAAPLADSFAARAVISNSAFTGAGDNRSATKEPGEPNHAGNPGGKSVWFRWVPPVSGIATISTAGSTLDTLLAVYQGSSLTNLALVAEDDDSGGFFTSQVRFNVMAGQSYEVVIDGLAAAAGDIILKLEIEPTPDQLPEIVVQPAGRTVPPGILVAFAVTARGGNPALGLNYHWLKDGVEILNATNSTYSIPNVRAENVGTYTVRVTQGARAVLSQAAVLQINTSTIGTLVDNIAAADKFANAVLAAGVLPIQPPAPNDESPPHPPPASGYTGTQIFSTVGASKEQDEPNHCGVSGGASQWFSFQAPADGLFILKTEGSSFDTVLAVYTNNGPVIDFTNLVQVACDSNSGLALAGSTVTFSAKKNTLYYVAIDGVNAARGMAQLNYQFVVPLRITSWAYHAGQFQLQFTGQPGGSFVLQRSSTLTNWTTLLTTNSTSGSVSFAEPNLSGFDRRYYRVFQP